MKTESEYRKFWEDAKQLNLDIGLKQETLDDVEETVNSAIRTINAKQKTMKKAEFAVSILKQCADESGIIIRSTSDLSPFEEWLIGELYKKKLTPSGNK